MKEWHVSEEVSLSDHREINFFMEYTKDPDTLYRNPRNTNLRDFSIYQNIDTAGKLDAAVEHLTRSINTAYNRSCPGRHNKPNKNHWWNNELQKLRLESRRLNRIAMASKGTPSEENCWRVLLKSKNLYSKEIRRAKQQGWVNFCQNIEGASAISRLHKLMAKDPTKGPGILKKPNGELTKGKDEAAYLLLDTHFPCNERVTQIDENGANNAQSTNSHEHPQNHSLVDTRFLNVNNIANKIITSERVEWAIFTFDRYKSPGNDNIYPVLLHRAWHVIGKCVVNLYNASLNLCYVPKIWQEVKVVFIPKPGKDDYTSPKSFRPISLTSVLLKGLERLIDRYIKDILCTSF